MAKFKIGEVKMEKCKNGKLQIEKTKNRNFEEFGSREFEKFEKKLQKRKIMNPKH